MLRPLGRRRSGSCVGGALPVLLLIFIYDRPVFEMVQTESLSKKFVRTLASAIGLVVAVPATTAIAILTVGGAGVSSSELTSGRSRLTLGQ